MGKAWFRLLVILVTAITLSQAGHVLAAGYPGGAAEEAAGKETSVMNGWRLVWSEEFDGPEIDRSVWNFDTGNGQAAGVAGWGNAELEYYTDDPANAYIHDGKLVIRADKGLRTDRFGTYHYTSARLNTKGKVNVKYGRIEVRAKLPEGQGIWPAIWLLGADIGEKGWPACGEIDIMELVGHMPGTVHGTIHGPLSGGPGISASYTLPGGRKFSEDFHVFGMEWSEGVIEFFVDDTVYQELRRDRMPKSYAEREWVYDHEFFFIVNVAVGGRWPGYPDESTVFPQAMEIDYIRVYQQQPEN